jgi:hypothetical protein
MKRHVQWSDDMRGLGTEHWWIHVEYTGNEVECQGLMSGISCNDCSIWLARDTFLSLVALS